MLNPVDMSGNPQPDPATFGIRHEELGAETSVVAVEGELDLAAAPRLKWTLIDLLKAGHKQLVLDLSRVSFMDSTALGVLIGINRSLAPGTRLAIACATSHVLKVFELTGLDGSFQIFSTFEAALAYVRGEKPPES